MAAVTELGYVGFNVSDMDAWRKFATSVAGLEAHDEDDKDRTYLRMDYWHHRLALHKSDEDDLAYMGWRVADSEALQAVKEQLEAAGYQTKPGGLEKTQERKVLGLFTVDDPSGNPVEVFFGPLINAHMPFHPGRRMHGKWLTGSQGLGHLLIRSYDSEESHRFYSALGLKGNVQYHLNSPDGIAKPTFMYCNDRHHSLAFGVGDEKRINHMMLEYDHLNDLGQAHDIVRERNIAVALQLGKHANDAALSFYFATPSGWLLELGWGGEPSFLQQQYHTQDIFGHGLEATGMLDVEL